jgi:hypothetical protein
MRSRLAVLRDQEKAFSQKALERSRESLWAFSERLKGKLFNIGAIPAKQSCGAVLHPGNGKSCRRAEKGAVAAPHNFPAGTQVTVIIA